jgi:hypothetical protein
MLVVVVVQAFKTVLVQVLVVMEEVVLAVIKAQLLLQELMG